MTVDVIIPSYYPGAKFVRLLDMLGKQTIPVTQIIVINTEREGWNKLLEQYPEVQNIPNMQVWHITKEEFDHGKTRRLGVEKSSSERFVMMTDDAIPADDCLLYHLMGALDIPGVAVAYGRQLPGADASLAEQFTRQFNYSEHSMIKSKEDLGRLGIKTFFCSDVCAAYRREIYDAQGGFITKAIFNEDMIFAAGCIQAGYKIAYAADAKVIHSHKYTNMQQFRRNFDLGVSQADHPEVFASVPSESEGIKMVKQTAAYLVAQGHPFQVIPMCITSAYKYLGYRKGKHYKKLTREQIMKYTMNANYWRV